MPALLKLSDRIDATQARRNLAITAIALATYHAEHDAYPTTLDAIHSAKTAEDPFAAAPLIYRAVGDGYVLYSVGPNGIDDGGTPSGGQQPKGPDDIVVRAGAEATIHR